MIKNFDITDALISLMGDIGWSTADDIAIFSDPTANNPSQSELVLEVQRLQAEYDGLEYSRNRKVKYDELNQDEMRYDDMINNTNTWGNAIEAIKVLYPKPI